MFKRSRSDGYDRKLLLSVLVLSLAIHGKLISLRELEKECRYDVRFRVFLNGDYPSYKTFERFINKELNKYFKEKDIDVEYSILKKPSFLYLFEITDKLEDYTRSVYLKFVKGKGKRKSTLQKIYEKIAIVL